MKKLLLFIFLSNFLVHTYGQDNPFRIDVVITEMEKGKYNVDTYFFDSRVSDGKIILEKDATVLDHGVFIDPNLFK